MAVIRRRAKAERPPAPSPSREPRAAIGEFACLKVKEIRGAGAVLDAGLDEDLLLPRFEQSRPVRRRGQRVVAYVHRDPITDRIVASTKLERFFSEPPESLKEGAAVDLLPYARTDLGFNAVVDQSFKGLLYHDASESSPKLGVPIRGYVARVRSDGRVDLSLEPSGVQGIEVARERLLETLRATGGRLELGDKSSPEAIRAALGLSKKAFKKAAGALYRERRITLTDDSIELLHEPTQRWRRKNEEGSR